MKYAVFDFDKTIIKKDSLMPLAMFILNKKKKYLNFFGLIIFYVLLKFNVITNKKFKEKYLELVFDNLKKEEITKIIRDFEQKFLIKNINKTILEKINYHKVRDDKLILISSNFDIFLKKLNILKEFEIISTETFFNEKSKKYKIKGEICKDNEKVRKLKLFYSDEIFEKGIFYGDSEDKILLNKFKYSIKIK